MEHACTLPASPPSSPGIKPLDDSSIIGYTLTHMSCRDARPEGEVPVLPMVGEIQTEAIATAPEQIEVA